MDFWTQLTQSTFMPHGHCYQWTPGIVWGHVVSDSLIAISYFSMPAMLMALARRRGDLDFSWLFMVFAAFILACGTGHIIDIWNIWHGDYWLATMIRVVTALVSTAAAACVWRLLPTLQTLPTTIQLKQQVEERELLTEQLLHTQTNLERRVQERTEDLQRFAEMAADRELVMVELKQQINELHRELGRAPKYNLDFVEPDAGLSQAIDTDESSN